MLGLMDKRVDLRWRSMPPNLVSVNWPTGPADALPRPTPSPREAKLAISFFLSDLVSVNVCEIEAQFKSAAGESNKILLIRHLSSVCVCVRVEG